MLSDYEAVAKLLKNSGHAVVLTGAGISTESGIPDYRVLKGSGENMIHKVCEQIHL